ncbi:MAG: PIN domain-containing protein [Chloroflexi bacterium]|nr:PIN domain-containing protein [Chloroflexota bacterium]
MKIDDAFHDVNLVYVDTAPFIYFTEDRVGFVDKMKQIFGYVNSGELRITTSVLTLTEILVKPLEANDAELVNRYRTMLYKTKGIITVTVSAGIAETAATLRSIYKLKTPDALHIAAALSTGCDAFLTNDIALRNVSDKITVLVLDELEI